MEWRWEFSKWPFWRVCAFLTFLLLVCATPIEDAAHGWSSARSTTGAPDFLGDYLGGRLARSKGHQNLYPAFTTKRRETRFEPLPGTPEVQYVQSERVKGWLPFINPPFFALVMEPLTVLPWQDAYFAWQLASIVMTVLALVFLFLTYSARGFDLATLSVLVASALAFHPFKMTINHGQFEAAMLLFWALGVYFFARRRPTVSAFWFALGTVTKISPALAVPLFALRRQWRWLAAYVIWIVAFLGFSVWRLGWQNHILWLTNVYPTLSCPVELFVNRSLGGFLTALGAPHAILGAPRLASEESSELYRILTLLLYIGFLGWCWKKQKGATTLLEELSILPLVFVLISPVSFVHYFVLAVIPLTCFWLKIVEGNEVATNLQVGIIALVTLVLGTSLLDYVAVISNVSILSLFLVGLWPLMTIALIWVAMSLTHSAPTTGAARS